MNLSKMLSGFEAFSALSVLDGVLVEVPPKQAPVGTTRIGDVVMSVGVANDLVAPANDHSLATQLTFKTALRKRIERQERRDVRGSLSF
jgi:hypothetical protein